MDVDLYKAAVYGEKEAFNDYKGPLDCLVTRNQDTVLHVHLANQRPKVITLNLALIYWYINRGRPTLRYASFAAHLLDECPSLLLKANAKGEIPLHIAATFGYRSTVELLLERAKSAHQGDKEKGLDAAKEMLRINDEEGNTPLHNAARYGHLDVVRELIKADPGFEYPANKKGESPLYIAARRGFHQLVAEMLDKCNSVAHAGPEGATALHSAVMSNNPETVRIILEKKITLANQPDVNGRIPLHFAAHLGYRSIVIQLLKCDKSTAYTADSVGKMTALHMAARQGHASIMKDIIRYCPDCCEQVDKNHRNFLHFAVFTLDGFSVLQFFGDDIDIGYVSMRNPLAQEDENGHTPLQVLVSCCPMFYGADKALANDKVEISKENLITEEEKILKLFEEISSGEVAGVSVSPRQTYWKLPAHLEKTRDSHLVVVALIATVTFTSAFTVPGGYKNEQGPDQGTAILIHNAAFKMFIISDATAMACSLFALLIYFLMARPRFRIPHSIISYRFAYRATLLAVVAMVIAFITGAFAILQPSVGLAITTCFIGFSFFPLAFYSNIVWNAFNFFG